MTATEPIRLAHDGVECLLAPALGGSILRLRVEGVDLLRPAPSGTADVHQVACFPLVPFANRIGHGRLRYGAEELTIAPDPEGAPHALHGEGWRGCWQVERLDRCSATLVFEGTPQGWPWRYRVRQSIAIQQRGVAIAVEIENRDGSAMPAGAGIHPYFERRTVRGIRADARAMWANAADGLALALMADARFAGGGLVHSDSLEGLDNWFPCDGAPLEIELERTCVVLGGATMRGFHLYCPEGGTILCVEPTSHAPNAFGRGDIAESDIVPARARRVWHFTITAKQKGANS